MSNNAIIRLIGRFRYNRNDMTTYDFAVVDENNIDQPFNQLIGLEGYTLPEAGGALDAGDTLLEGLGKLEASINAVEGSEANIDSTVATHNAATTAVHGIADTSALALTANVVAKGSLVFNVKDYGAVGNGETDDRTAIDDCSYACSQAGGGVVVFPPGVYLVGNYVTLRTGVTYRGSGAATTLKLKSGSNTNVMDNPGGSISNCTVRDMVVDGNKAGNTAGAGVSFPAFSNSIIQGVVVKNTFGRGIYLYNCIACLVSQSSVSGSGGAATTANGTQSGIVVQVGSENTVSQCSTSSSADTGILLTATTYGRVLGCLSKTASFIGIGLGSGSSSCSISGCTVENSVDNGIDVGNVSVASVTGNVVSGCGEGIVGDTAVGVSVCGNTIDSTTATDSGGLGAGIEFTSATTSSRITVMGNTVNLAGGHGISFYNVSDSAISGNIVRNSSTLVSTRSGIALGGNGTPNRIVVSGNRSYDDRGTKLQVYGITSYGSVIDYVLVTGNILSGNLTGAISLVGSNNVNANNITA